MFYNNMKCLFCIIKARIKQKIKRFYFRITKYPLLIEPLIKTAKDRPEERQKLNICHQLVKSILVDVNGQVKIFRPFYTLTHF